MILIGRGLDLGRGNRDKGTGNRRSESEPGSWERISKPRRKFVRECEGKRKLSWSDSGRETNLCGFEGAKPEAGRRGKQKAISEAKSFRGSREAVVWPIRRRKKGGSERDPNPVWFPVTIA